MQTFATEGHPNVCGRRSYTVPTESTFIPTSSKYSLANIMYEIHKVRSSGNANFGAVVVAHSVERLLPTTEVHSPVSVMVKFYLM